MIACIDKPSIWKWMPMQNLIFNALDCRRGLRKRSGRKGLYSASQARRLSLSQVVAALDRRHLRSDKD